MPEMYLTQKKSWSGEVLKEGLSNINTDKTCNYHCEINSHLVPILDWSQYLSFPLYGIIKIFKKFL
jgi:hypothetical protein